MRSVLYLLIIGLSFFAPVTKLDIANLSPVEAVAVYIEQGDVHLKTDEGDIGSGADAIAALQDLKESACSIIYLDTARYLLIGEGAEEAATSLRQHLSSSVKTGKYAGGSVKDEAKYLSIHADSDKPEN